MTEPLSTIGAQLLGASDEPDHPITCAWCSKKTVCPGFIWAAVRTWNLQEGQLATENDRRANFIAGVDMGVCCPGDCTANFRTQKLRDSEEANATTIVYLRELRAGRYNPITLQWLRDHGHASTVIRILNEEGNRSHG